MKEDMHQSKDHHSIPMTSVSSGKVREVTKDVAYYTDQIVNLMFAGAPREVSWTLVDAGMPNSSNRIIEIAEERYGKGTRPQAIILTHGHFDHVGSIVDLLNEWGNVPVYAHPAEFPFLTGKQAYPDPDPTVQGGMLAKISSIYPHEPIDITQVLRELPADGSIPGMPGWRWVHTPGHSPGHVSLFRESDRFLIAGDAFVTVKQDSMYKVLVQKKEVHGPPVYLTTDWDDAQNSVQKLSALEPAFVITGHGTHMEGQELREGLKSLAASFNKLARPDYGKYVDGQNK